MVKKSISGQVYWWVCHDIELPINLRYDRRISKQYPIPSVMRLQPETGKVKLTESWQRLIYESNMRLNPHITEAQGKQAFRSLLKWNRAYTNGSGFDNPNGETYADYINNLDIDSPPPSTHQPLVCSGASLIGKKDSRWLYPEMLDGTKEAPSVEFLLENPHFYHYCVSVWWLPEYENLDVLEPFPQFWPNTIFPNVANGQVKYELNRLIELDNIDHYMTIHRKFI